MIKNGNLWNNVDIKARVRLRSIIRFMKFIAIIGAFLIQAALSTTALEEHDAAVINNVVQEGKTELANKLSHLSAEQLAKFKELREAQKNFKASLKANN